MPRVGEAEVPTDEVGVAILGPLELDPVAYLRFASVYKHYNSVDDFIAEIDNMREAARYAPSWTPRRVSSNVEPLPHMNFTRNNDFDDQP